MERELKRRLMAVLEDGIAIIEAMDDDDCDAWLGQARPVLAVLVVERVDS